MRAVCILIALLTFSSPCLAQGERSFVRHVGEHNFRILSPAFFYQLHMQFCAKAKTDTCTDNINTLQRDWIFFDSTLQSIERQRVQQPMAFLDMGVWERRYEQLNAQVVRFVETEGKSVTTEDMNPKVLGH